MAPQECSLDYGVPSVSLTERSVVSTSGWYIDSHYTIGYPYAVTMKPNLKVEQNSKSIIEIAMRNAFDDMNSTICDIKYEMDAKHVLHVHFTYITEKKLKSFYPYFKKGWMVHLSYIKDKTSYDKWRNYLTKGATSDQVLEEAAARLDYLFV